MALFSVYWSPAVQISYFHILEYLDEKWTEKELKSFIVRTEEVIELICDNPLIYPFSKKGEAHKCVVVKQVSLIYRIKGNKIELLIFWDNRRDPQRLNL